MIGELVPKVFGLRNAEWVCLRLSPIMRGFALITHPVVRLFGASVEHIVGWLDGRWRPRVEGQGGGEPAALHELRAVAQLARATNLIGGREEAIIRNAAHLSRRPVREIMLPATHINMLNAEDSMADALIAAHLYMHTRFPVTERPGDPQGIIGFVNFKDIVAMLRLSPGQASLRGILHSLPVLSPGASVAASLEMMMRDHTHIALVRDAAGAVLGMVTLEDVLEALVGQMYDEHDRLPNYAAPAGAGWVVGGGISAARLKALTGVDLARHSDAGEGGDLSEWVARRLTRPARGGDVVEDRGLRVIVRKTRHGRTSEAHVAVLDKPAVPKG